MAGQELLAGESLVWLWESRECEGQESGSSTVPTTSGVGGCRSSSS